MFRFLHGLNVQGDSRPPSHPPMRVFLLQHRFVYSQSAAWFGPRSDRVLSYFPAGMGARIRPGRPKKSNISGSRASQKSKSWYPGYSFPK